MMKVPFSEIVVLEPDLRAAGSHHLEYARSLCAAADRAGVRLHFFCHRDADAEVRRVTGGTPTFADHGPWRRRLKTTWAARHWTGPLSWLINQIENGLRARELDVVFRGLDPRRRLVLIPNGNQDLLGALGRSLRGPLRRWPGAHAVLVCPFVPGRYLFRRAFRAVVPLVRAGSLHLGTDSALLAEVLQGLTGCQFEVLPMPFEIMAAQGNASLELPVRAVASAPGGKNVRLLICGGYRMEKGIDLLCDLLPELETEIAAGALSFTFQGYTNDTSPEPEAERHFARIRMFAARHPAGVRLVERVLDPEAYRELFAAHDVVLLPYRREAYGVRTSGVLMESLARGLPVVATAETWLGEQVRTHGAGLTFPDGNVEALAAAVRQVATNLPALRAKAQLRRVPWLAFHNPDHYLTRLMTLAGGRPIPPS